MDYHCCLKINDVSKLANHSSLGYQHNCCADHENGTDNVEHCCADAAGGGKFCAGVICNLCCLLKVSNRIVISLNCKLLIGSFIITFRNCALFQFVCSVSKACKCRDLSSVSRNVLSCLLDINYPLSRLSISCKFIILSIRILYDKTCAIKRLSLAIFLLNANLCIIDFNFFVRSFIVAVVVAI